MNKYTIKRLYTCIAEVEVCADTEDEARNLASKRFDEMNRNNFYFNEDGTTIEDVQPIEDNVDELTKLAIELIKSSVEEDGDAISFSDVDVTISVREVDPVFLVPEYVEYDVQVDSAYVLKVSEPSPILMIQFSYEYMNAYDLEDKPIDEFDHLEQLAILKAILAK